MVRALRMDFIVGNRSKARSRYEVPYFHRSDLSCGRLDILGDFSRCVVSRCSMACTCRATRRTVSVNERIEKNEGKPVVTNPTWT